MRLLLSLFVMLVFHPETAWSQISPGPLSRRHADLEGVLQCTKCHTFGTGRQELKCSSCHTEIVERLKDKRGYHSRVVDTSKGNAACATCHAEHVGRDFDLIRWPPPGRASFDHAQTGYRLEGKHRSLQCNQCHNAAKIDSRQKAGILIKDLDRSFLGLGTDCTSCHADTHRGQLGANCTSCHSQEAWKPVPGFDHQRTRFPLTGLHTRVSCQQCHGASSGSLSPHYTVTNFSDCSGCHKDPHRGAFNAACTQCHSTAGWNVSKGALTSKFDHSRTRYPLTGKHAGVACSSCHKTTNFSERIASSLCLDCHRDKHDGQFAKRLDRGDCASCHTVNGFDRWTFDIKAHASTRYPLVGKHAEVACEKCHARRGNVIDYHPKSAACTDCHKDPHAGQFLTRYQDKCDTCHDVNGFTPSMFTLVRHRTTRFELAGAHAAAACTDCHKKTSDAQPHRYLFEDRSCVACHRDPHELKRESQACETCHTLSAWTPARPFDHNSTRFLLIGAHASLPCLSCHKPANNAAGKQILFAGAPQQCAGCHEDIHAGQFAGRSDGGGCGSCHSSTTWKPLTGFDHARSAFPLDGAHRKVRCVLCHSTTSRVNGRGTLIYKDAPTECAKCH